uniref:Class II major histocompatibility complex transactivator n=1 Tax=Crocodylus porosus TaxID=8502 RepID=A0A7M4E6J4_CROPO
MNLFKEILPRVRKILSSATLSDAHALLSLMLKEDVISKEYYQTLLHEKDREDLARKISLTFVEKWDLCLNTLVPLCYLKVYNNKHQSITDGNKRQTMDSSILTENSFLDLLHSDIDPVHLYTLLDAKSTENEESEVLTDPETDTINHDQFNNLDIFYTMESSESGEELYICSNTREAYARIAGLAEYVLKDPQERQMEDTFAGNLVFDEMASESTERFTDVKMQKCHKRKFLGTAENHCDTSEPKCRKTVDSPAGSTVNSSFLSVTLNGSPVNSSSFSLLHIPFSVTTISPTGRSFIAPGKYAPEEFPFLTKGDINENILKAMLSCISFYILDSSTHTCFFFILEPVEAFCMSLKDYFCDVCKFMPMEREVTLDQLYIEGALLQGQHETRSGKNIIKGIEREPVIYDLEEKEKTALERNQIFQVPGGKELETKIIVLLGKAGIGKSILVQKICQDWSNGKFSQFEFVFWYECRRLSLPEKQYSLKDFLLEVFVRPQEGKEEVFKYILQNPSKVLLIFDGFEELQDHDGFTHFPDCQSYKEQYSMRELFAGLFQKKILSGCTLLLTARPKDKLNQYLSKVDKIIEMVGFSPQQAELYISRYFEGLPYCNDAMKLIKDCQYLFSHCYSPVMCRFICFLCEMVFEMGHKDLPSTLSTLLLKFFQEKLTPAQTDGTTIKNQQNIVKLAQVAWSLGEQHQNALKSDLFPSKEIKEFALKHGFVLPFTFPKQSGNKEEEFGSVFSNFIIQNFLGTLHLVFAEEIKDKSLTKYFSFPSRKKKSHNWLDLMPQFLSGILFLQDDPYLCSLSNKDVKKIITKKQKTLLKYIKRVQISSLCPERLLELFHCVYETQDRYLLQNIALRLEPELSFLGTPLTPPDVYVLHSILKRSKKEFALDLRNSAIDLQGMKDLVGLKNVTSFRASLTDTMRLWESLEQTQEYDLLKISIQKFAIDPFKAKSMRDISDLSGKSNSRSVIFGSLDALSENGIGDEGVKNLSQVFSQLTSLEVLNLSQNEITDLGAEKLATALPSLSSLKTLSLYNNSICDAGAENIAKVLPAMASLRVLDVQYNKITDTGAQRLSGSLRKCPHMKSLAMWNPTIPYGVLEHLQQLDSRIIL